YRHLSHLWLFCHVVYLLSACFYITSPPPTARSPLSLHDALPISRADCRGDKSVDVVVCRQGKELDVAIVSRDAVEELRAFFVLTDRKSTRLNSSHGSISYAVFCLKKITIQLRLLLSYLSCYCCRH